MGDLRRRSLLQTVGNRYTRIEYIESTGTQFIDTGVKLFENGNVSYRIVIDAILYSSTGANGCILNAMEEKSPYPGVSVRLQDGRFGYAKGGTYADLGTVGDLNTLVHADISDTRDVTHNVSTTLFAGYDENNNPWRYSITRLYRCQIYDHDVLVGDYVPIRIGAEGCLYDKVSGGVLHNLGTGDFVCGGDLTHIEYLESSGTQYIDTYFIATGGSICEYEGTFLQSTCVIVGGHDTSSNNDYNRNYMRFRNGSIFDAHKCDSTPSISRSDLINTKHLYYHNTIGTGNLGKIDGETVISGGSTYILAPNTTIEVFRLRWEDSRYSSRIYWLKIYNSNSVLVRDYIPVRCGTTGYLYDQLNDILYWNAGSGSFTLGADTEPRPIPIFKVSTTDGSSREGITFFLSDGTNTYTYVTDANGEALVYAPTGTYTISSTYWTLSINSVTLSGQKKVTFTATKTGEDFVDLGLSVLWASGNICRSGNVYYMGSSTDNGCYYSWGNIEGHNKGEGYNFSDSVYQSTPGYTLTGNISGTDAAHDAALACLGTGYRMPTKAESEELVNGCTWNWKTINSVNGWEVVGSNGKKIFLPCAGYYDGTTFRGSNSSGTFWTTAFYGPSNAYGFNFDSSRHEPEYRCIRSAGVSVRAIKTK